MIIREESLIEKVIVRVKSLIEKLIGRRLVWGWSNVRVGVCLLDSILCSSSYNEILHVAHETTASSSHSTEGFDARLIPLALETVKSRWQGSQSYLDSNHFTPILPVHDANTIIICAIETP